MALSPDWRPVRASPGFSGLASLMLPNNESRLMLPYGATKVSVTVPSVEEGILGLGVDVLVPVTEVQRVQHCSLGWKYRLPTSLPLSTTSCVLVKPNRFVTSTPVLMVPISVPPAAIEDLESLVGQASTVGRITERRAADPQQRRDSRKRGDRVEALAPSRQLRVEREAADAESVCRAADSANVETGEGVTGVERVRCVEAEQRIQVDVAGRRHQRVGNAAARDRGVHVLVPVAEVEHVVDGSHRRQVRVSGAPGRVDTGNGELGNGQAEEAGDRLVALDAPQFGAAGGVVDIEVLSCERQPERRSATELQQRGEVVSSATGSKPSPPAANCGSKV